MPKVVYRYDSSSNPLASIVKDGYGKLNSFVSGLFQKTKDFIEVKASEVSNWWDKTSASVSNWWNNGGSQAVLTAAIGVGVVVAAVAITVATGGAAAPVLISAGIGLASSAAIDVGTQYIQNGGDWSKYDINKTIVSASIGMSVGAVTGAMGEIAQATNLASKVTTGSVKGTTSTVTKSAAEVSDDAVSAVSKGTGNAKNAFPKNPSDMLPDVPSNTTPKGNIKWEPNQNTRIQYHPGDTVKPGETYIPRHHDPHYHVEIRNDPTKGWNNPGNTQKLQPPGYTPGSGTGFLPGETFPK